MDKEGMAALPVDIPVALDPRRLIMTPEQRDELRWCNAIMQQQKMPGERRGASSRVARGGLFTGEGADPRFFNSQGSSISCPYNPTT